MTKGIGITIILLLVVDLAWRKYSYDCATGRFDQDKKPESPVLPVSQQITNFQSYSNW